MAIASKNANKHNLKNALDMKINKHQCGSQYIEHGQIITHSGFRVDKSIPFGSE